MQKQKHRIKIYCLNENLIHTHLGIYIYIWPVFIAQYTVIYDYFYHSSYMHNIYTYISFKLPI